MTRSTTVTGTMSDADSLLWTIGSDPVLRPTVVAVALLDRPPCWETVQRRFRDLVTTLPTFRSRPVARPLGLWRPRWVDDGTFELDAHLRRVPAPAPARLRSVLDMAQAMAGSGFDSELSPWEALVVDGLEGGQAALIVKLHHALVDGVGGIAVLLHLLDSERSGPSPDSDRASEERSRARRMGPGKGEGPTWRAYELGPRAVGAPMHRLSGLVGSAAAAASGVVRHPLAHLRAAKSTTTSIAKLLAPSGRPLSELTSGRSTGRWFEVIDLPPNGLRRAARALGGTVNDAFVAGVVMGIGRYHELHAAPIDNLRLLMPINVRSDSQPLAGNHFVPARFVVPVSADPEQCMRDVHRIAGSYKGDPVLALSDLLAAGLDLLPGPVATALWGSMLKGDDFCATNVPGPPFETFLGGARVDRLYAFAPPSGAAMNVSLLTPAGHDCVGVNIDTAAVPDAAKLALCLAEGFEAVLSLSTDSAL